MVGLDDLYKIPISKNDLVVANYLARIRLPFEYQRAGHQYYYGQLSSASEEINAFFKEDVIAIGSNNVMGILAELKVYQDLCKCFPSWMDQYSRISKGLIYKLIIGAYDDGYDISIGDVKIDVKCYGTVLLQSDNQVIQSNIFVDQDQYSKIKDDKLIILQTFLLKQDNQLWLCVGGYTLKKDLQYMAKCKNPCYAKLISQSSPYRDLQGKLLQ